MPYIQAKLSNTLDKNQKNELQYQLTEIVSEAFGKPKQYIMTEIQTDCSLYMAGNPVERGAYLAISLLGSPTKPACEISTQKICELLSQNYGIESSTTYITYHPAGLWGWNGMMF